MDKPELYNDITLYIEPAEMVRLAMGDLKGHATEIADTLTAIQRTWGELKLSWFGDTADAAADFEAKWTAIGRGLFGVAAGGAGPHAASGSRAEASQPPGSRDNVLGKIIEAVAMAGSNFGDAENAVVDVFSGFTERGSATAPDTGLSSYQMADREAIMGPVATALETGAEAAKRKGG